MPLVRLLSEVSRLLCCLCCDFPLPLLQLRWEQLRYRRLQPPADACNPAQWQGSHSIRLCLCVWHGAAGQDATPCRHVGHGKPSLSHLARDGRVCGGTAGSAASTPFSRTSKNIPSKSHVHSLLRAHQAHWSVPAVPKMRHEQVPQACIAWNSWECLHTPCARARATREGSEAVDLSSACSMRIPTQCHC